MPCLTSGVPNLLQTGPIIEVLISPSTVLRKQLESQGIAPRNPIKKFFLIDTGASSTVMKSGIAQELGLIAKGQIVAHTPSSANFVCYTYDVDFVLPKHLLIANLLVCEAPLQGQDIDGLLGRDILSMGILIYTGYANQFTLAI